MPCGAAACGPADVGPGLSGRLLAHDPVCTADRRLRSAALSVDGGTGAVSGSRRGATAAHSVRLSGRLPGGVLAPTRGVPRSPHTPRYVGLYPVGPAGRRAWFSAVG